MASETHGTPVAPDPAPEHGRPAPPQIDTTVAHPARVYDFWLGGKDHFAPDREAGLAVIEANPGIVPGVRANRAFLVRAVRHLVRDAGITQILDIGTGLPSANNVHEVAQEIAPDTRVVYVDNDPIVLVHAHALLTGEPGTVDYVDADLRVPGDILRSAARTLDLDRPVALMLLMTLQFVRDDDDPFAITRTLLDALAPGSYLVISHPARDDDVGIANAATSQYNEKVATPMTRRTKVEIARFFDGLQLVEPGIVPMVEWRPDPWEQVPRTYSPAYCGVARKP
jgi:SAM-dependent methyltransferase